MKNKSNVLISESNVGISMVESYGMFFRHYNYDAILELERKFKIIPKMHIYMVIETPKIIFVKDSINIETDKITLKIRILDNGIENEIELNIENPTRRKDLQVKLSNNKDDMELRNATDNKILLKGNALMTLLSSKYVLDCKVVYIGRSFGKDGEKTVYERLKSHSTLQKIYAEKEDDKSIFLSSWNFDRNSISFLSPLDLDVEKGIEFFTKQYEMSKNPYKFISKKQEINFTEAALIRYFQPKYNDKMKFRFPSKTHIEYLDLFKQNIDYVSIELDTSRLYVRLFSDTVTANSKHNPFYDLKGKRNKYDFFRII